MTEDPKTLDQVCDFIVDCLHKTAPTQEDGYPLIRTPNIGKGRLKLEGVFRVSEETYEIWTQRAVPEPGDLILAREALAGNVAVIGKNQQVCLGQRTVHLRPDRNQVHPVFLCYFLLTPKLQGALLAGETGATAKHVNMKDIRRLRLPGLPDLPTQRAIADILSAYDDLIENNRRRMALLEESARLLYREWFVHLRFPGHEHVPVKDGVPEGWERRKIGDASAFLSRGITPTYDDDAPGLVINQKCIRNNRVTLDCARRQSKEVPLARLIRRGDVLINSTGEGTLGRVAQLWVEIENCTVDSHVTIVRPAEGIPLGLFGAALCSLEGKISQMGRGSTNQTELSKNSVAELPILLPPNGLAQEFEEINSSLSSQISNLSNQIRQLSSARDLLLPRLMNGEIAV